MRRARRALAGVRAAASAAAGVAAACICPQLHVNIILNSLKVLFVLLTGPLVRLGAAKLVCVGMRLTHWLPMAYRPGCEVVCVSKRPANDVLGPAGGLARGAGVGVSAGRASDWKTSHTRSLSALPASIRRDGC